MPVLTATDRRGAIEELSAAIAAAAGLDAKSVLDHAWERELQMPTGLGEGVAAPHARMDNAPAAVVALGVSKSGIDFDAPDGQPAELIFLIVTPESDDSAQLELLADIAGTLRDSNLRKAVMNAQGGTELLALLRSGPSGDQRGASGLAGGPT